MAWTTIKGWPAYQVSDDGRIRSVDRVIVDRRGRTRRYPGTELKQTIRNQYLRVTLCDEARGRRKTPNVHQLVAAHFVGGRPKSWYHVNHIDTDKLNNSAANLEWVTPKANKEHADRHGLIAKGSRIGTSVLNEMEVVELRKLYNNGSLSVGNIAKRFGVSRQTVTKIGRRKCWTHI